MDRQPCDSAKTPLAAQDDRWVEGQKHGTSTQVDEAEGSRHREPA